MTKANLWIAVLSSVALLTLAACGGGGQGLRVENDPVLVTSTSIPPVLSGETLRHVIPLQGGCGGPYVLQVVGGGLPRGLELDDENHALVGAVLEDGEFAFTVQVIDTGCKPFLATTASFRMTVGIGELRVVGAIRDGNSVLLPAGEESYNPDYPTIGASVYNDYATVDLVVAGGHGPYSAALFDDPDVPNDGSLPLGTSVPPGSTSINGAPVQVGPNGGPFLCTLQIADSIGEKTLFTFYWLVETPPIVFATDGWSDGQAGTSYSQQVFVAEGVPPFEYEFVEAGLPVGYTSDKADNPNLDPSTNVIYNPGGPPTVTPAGALVKIDGTYYPPASAATTNDGVPPEGAALDELTGSFSGIPRRIGDFTVHLHVHSSLVPNSFGQHAWGTLGFSISQAPPIAQDPAYTLAPAFTSTPPYAQIVEASKGEIYNPDGGPRGLQILAVGGVPDDGYTDAPHRSQTALDPAETMGAYKWSIDWNPDAVSGQAPVAGMELTGLGVFRIVEIGGVPQIEQLIPQFDQAIAFTAADSALPDSLASSATEKVSFGIGPDRILVTSSSTTMANSTDLRSWDDSAMTLQYVIPTGVAYTLRAPGEGDLTGDGDDKHALPSEAGSTTVGALLTDVDLLRISVNPTGYWDDNVYLNPNAARPFQNSLSAYYYPYYGVGSAGSTSYASSSYNYGFQPATACVELPDCTTANVTTDKATGVYADGGKLHVFDTSTHFGVFIVRQDGKLYVPAAFSRATSGYISFGDNWTYGYRASSSTHSATRIPQMTVSPDGRIAAFKLKRNTSYSQTETASTTPILLISLTGERIAAWGDQVYKVVNSGSNATSSTGYYLYASSLTLTNDFLYFIVGNQTTYAHFRDHYIYRYAIASGDGAASLLHSNFNAEWTNSPGSPMQMPFQFYGQAFCTDTSTGSPDYLMYGSHAYNSWEGAQAPHPFRVSRQGNACALLAGLNTSATTTEAVDVLFHHVWVDYEGDLHQLSTQRRHTSGGGRGVVLCSGPSYTPISAMWNDYNGPSSRFEISDDGLAVAVVYYRNPTVDPYVAASSTEYVYRYREDIAAFKSTDSAWGGRTVHEVTGDASTNTGYSTSYVGGPFGYTSSTYCHAWRFGALTFTLAGDGIVFWGGYSSYDPTGTTHDYYRYASAKSFVGSLYSYDFDSGYVRSILAAADGGCNKTLGSIIDKPNFSTTSWQVDGGVIKPVAGFRSQSGEFLYLCTRGAVSTSTSRQRDGALLGVNVRSLNTGASINSRADGRAFYVEGFGTTNGFLPATYPYCAYGMGMYSYSSNYTQYYNLLGFNNRVVSPNNGWIYFTSVNCSTSLYTSTSSTYGGPIRSTYGLGYVYYPKSLYVFDPNLGGNVFDVGGTGWSGTSYQLVQGLVVSKDGSRLIEVGSRDYSNYHYHDQENLTVFSGIALNPNTGALPSNSVTLQQFEAATCVGDCAAFSPKGDRVYYGAGSTSTGTSLKWGAVGGSSTGTTLGLPPSRWTVLHAGR